ncbi:MAG: hypothetical protein AMXMBFR82_25210 [Candidatus Hydrogenedentota bacterium]
MTGGPVALIETTTLDAMGEAARVYTQALDIGSGEAISSPMLLPGNRPLGFPLCSETYSSVAITTEERYTDSTAPSATFVTLVDDATGYLAPFSWSISDVGWSHRAAALVPPENERNPLLVTLTTPQNPESVGPGRVEVHRLTRERPATIVEKAASWLLPGSPAAAIVLAGRNDVAVLCGTGPEGAVLHVRDLERGEVVMERLDLYPGHPEYTPAALVQTSATGEIVVLATGPGSDRQSFSDATRVCAVDPDTWEAAGSILELKGVANPELTPVQVSGDGTFWVSTREPHSGFAYLTQLRASVSGIEKLAEYPFTGTDGPLLLAVARTGSAVAVAIGNRVEVWPGGAPGGTPFRFESRVNALAWAGHSLLAGEANRVHAIEPVTGEMKPRLVTAIQTGIINAIVPLAGTPLYDSDAVESMAALEVPPPHFVRLRGESAGSELRAVQVIPDDAQTRWRVDWDRRQIPWLSLYPQTGNGRGWFLMGVDKQLYERGSTASGSINLYLDPDSPDGARQQYRIAVRVAPSHPLVRRVLWVLGRPTRNDLRHTSDPLGFKMLADLLAAPPLHFSHHLAEVPIATPLTPYAVVVLDSEAVVTGMVTRQAVLDYVSRGGALVYLPQSVNEPNRERVARWLGPAGLLLIPNGSAPGQFVRAANTPLTRETRSWRVSEAVALQAEPPWQVLMATPDGRYAGFAARRLGSGRIAVLASREPLESQNLEAMEDRQFAADLFAWLGDAGVDVQDLDDDGFADDREDPDQDGVVDPGETDRLDPDTDGDGVPDGVDVDPLNPDTDGDGTLDGADLTPNGPTGAAPGLLPLAD